MAAINNRLTIVCVYEGGLSPFSLSLSDVVFPAPRGHKNLHSQCQFSSGLNCVCKMIWALLPYNNLDLELVRTIALLPSLSFSLSPLVISQTLILRATAYRLWARAMLGDANLMSHLCRLCRRPVAIVICVSLKGYKWTPTPTTVTAPTPYSLSLPSLCFLHFTCSSIVVNLRLVIEWECLLARPRDLFVLSFRRKCHKKGMSTHTHTHIHSEAKGKKRGILCTQLDDNRIPFAAIGYLISK